MLLSKALSFGDHINNVGGLLMYVALTSLGPDLRQLPSIFSDIAMALYTYISRSSKVTQSDIYVQQM